MQKLYYYVGLGLLVILGLVWLGRLTIRPEVTRTEPPPGPPTPAITTVPVVQPDTPGPEAVRPTALKAVKDELTALHKQQRAELATLRQQQEAALAALQQRLERLFAEHRTLTRQLGDLALLADQGAVASQTPDNGGAVDVETTVDQVAQAHETQAVDPAWSGHAQTAIEQSFSRYSQELPGTVLLDTECRTTVCRIAVAFESEESRDEVFRLLPHLIPWSADGLLHLDTEMQTVIFYAAREGENLEAAR